MFAEPITWRPEQLRVGLRSEFEREVTEADIIAFARNSGDCNPLHVDAEYARASNFRARIAHGAFQVGLASALLGMHLPGRLVLLGSVQARFPSPLFFPCQVHVRGEITAWDRELNAGQLRVTILEAATRTPTAEVVMGFTLHQSRSRTEAAGLSAVSAPLRELADPSRERPALLITGAAGGIGAALVRDLAARYLVVPLVNRRPLDEDLRTLPNVVEVRGELGDGSWEEKVPEVLAGQPLFGVVHAAWPGAPHGGLLQCADDLLEQQIAFGSTHLVRLGRLLFSLVGKEGGRLIALGSVVGSASPNLSMAAYSVGKGTLELTVRLLAPEMARKQVTVNAVCPSFVPVGINGRADERQQKQEKARVPLGRLCTAADVVGAVDYLLSPGASFVSGQVLGLTGGQL